VRREGWTVSESSKAFAQYLNAPNHEEKQAVVERAAAYWLECVSAIDAIGGDPATVQELVAALRNIQRVMATEKWLPTSPTVHAINGELAVLAKIPEAP